MCSTTVRLNRAVLRSALRSMLNCTTSRLSPARSLNSLYGARPAATLTPKLLGRGTMENNRQRLSEVLLVIKLNPLLQGSVLCGGGLRPVTTVVPHCADVFRRPFSEEDVFCAHLLRGGPANESRDGGDCGPSATPQDAVAVRDADLSQELDRGANRRDGSALPEKGLLRNEDLLSLVQAGVAAPSHNKNVEGVGRSSFQCRVAPQTSIRHNALAEMKSNSGSAGTRPGLSPGLRDCAAQPSG